MRTDYHTDNAAPCHSCGGTVSTYTVDSEITLIDVICHSCNKRAVFCWRDCPEDVTAAQLSAKHRQAQRPDLA